MIYRNHQGRRDHGNQWSYRERLGHDVPGERITRGTGPLHDDALLSHRAPGPCWHHEGHRRYYREPCMPTPS